MANDSNYITFTRIKAPVDRQQKIGGRDVQHASDCPHPGKRQVTLPALKPIDVGGRGANLLRNLAELEAVRLA